MGGTIIKGFRPKGEITYPDVPANKYLVDDIAESARTGEVSPLVVMAEKAAVLLACRECLVGRIDDTQLLEHIFDIAEAQKNGKLAQWVRHLILKSRYASDGLKEKVTKK